MPILEPEIPKKEEEQEKLPEQKIEKKERESVINVVAGHEEYKGEKENWLKFYKKYFEREQKKIPEEWEKSPAAKELINFLGNAVPEFASQYGAEPIRVSEDKVHLVPENAMKGDGKTLAGLYDQKSQEILIRFDKPGAEPYLGIAKTTVHEMLHFNSFQSLGPDKEFGYEIDMSRRLGLAIKTRKGEGYFDKLSEAVIDKLTDRFIEWTVEGGKGPTELQEDARNYLESIAQFKRGIEKLKSEKEESQERMAKVLGVGKEAAAKLVSEQIAELEEQVHHVDHWALKSESGEENLLTLVRIAGYRKERDFLDKTVKEIYEKNKDEFESEEEIFNLFARATMSGRLLPLARVIEKTYGKGAFRKLGKKTKR